MSHLYDGTSSGSSEYLYVILCYETAQKNPQNDAFYSIK